MNSNDIGVLSSDLSALALMLRESGYTVLVSHGGGFYVTCGRLSPERLVVIGPVRLNMWLLEFMWRRGGSAWIRSESVVIDPALPDAVERVEGWVRKML